MDKQDIIKKKIILARSVIYALIITVSYLFMILFGITSVFRTGFITIFFGINIFKGIKIIREYAYFNSIPREIFNSFRTLMIAVLILMFTPYPMPSVSGKQPFQYRFSKMYTDKYCISSKQLLPDKLPDDVSDYSYFYFFGFMQANSELELSFTTNMDELRKIEKKAQERAVGVLDLEKYRYYNTNDQSGDEQVTEFKKSYFKANENGYTADYFAPRTGLAGKKEGAGKMYIIESNGNSNHPHTSCITVNYETCTISYTY